MWTPRTVALAAALAALTVAPRALAYEMADGKLSINGFGTWLYGRTWGSDNSYGDATPGGRYDSGQFALSLTGRPADRATVAVQVDVHPDNHEVELDWAFGEWRFSDQLRLQFGRFKHPIGLYGELRDVGTVHSFLFLPRAIYGPTEMTVEGVAGVGASGIALDQRGWTLSYDAYLGSLDTRTDDPYDKLLNPQDLQPGGVLEDRLHESKNTLGGRVALATPLEGLSLRLSGYCSATPGEPGESGVRWVVGPSVEYAADKLALQAEYFHHRDFDQASTDAAYVQASYFLTEHLRLALRSDLSLTELDDYPAGSPLLRHFGAALGVEWWFTPALVVKVSGHFIRGNRFARPELLDDALLAGDLQPITFATFGGVQFAL